MVSIFVSYRVVRFFSVSVIPFRNFIILFISFITLITIFLHEFLLLFCENFLFISHIAQQRINQFRRTRLHPNHQTLVSRFVFQEDKPSRSQLYRGFPDVLNTAAESNVYVMSASRVYAERLFGGFIFVTSILV